MERRLAYNWSYWCGTLRNLWVPHRLRPRRAGHYAAPFVPPPDVAARWCAVFGLDATTSATAPFLYSQSPGTLLYTRLFADLGINFRHLLHIQHRATHHALRTLGSQEVCSWVAQVAAAGRGKALLVLRSEVRHAEGQPVVSVEDRFIVRHLAAEQLRGLPAVAATTSEQSQAARRGASLSSAACWRREIAIPADLGRSFGRLSGDMNPHTTRLGARLIGHSAPFLQGLCTRNLIVGFLAQAGLDLARIEVHFGRPVYTAQTVGLAHDGDRFELTDGAGRLLADGRFALRESARGVLEQSAA